MSHPCRSPLPYHRQLARRKLGVIVLHTREQVPVYVEGHLNRAVADQRLYPLRRETPLDYPRCEEVPQGVDAVFRLHDRVAVLVLFGRVRLGDARLDLEWVEAPIGNVGVAFDVATAIRENKLE